MTSVAFEDVLHQRVLHHCLQLYLDGHFKHVVSEAMTQVELALNERVGSHGRYGIRLINETFDEKTQDIKLRVPFGPEYQEKAHSLLRGAFAYYRNYAAHNGALIDKAAAFRVMVLATELLELIDASEKSFSDIGGVEGLIKHGVFANEREVARAIRFLQNYILLEEAPAGFWEALYEAGHSEEQMRALIEVGLVEYESTEVIAQETLSELVEYQVERLGTFTLTSQGSLVLKELGEDCG